MLELLVFYLTGAVALSLAVLMVMARKPVTSAMSLVGVMFCLAVLFAMQRAHLIAVLQVLVYAGAIMVLFLFVMMLLNLREKEGGASHTRGVLQMAGGGVAAAMLWVFMSSIRTPLGPNSSGVEGFGETAEVGKLIFTKYLLPFEITSILLLAAMVGAVALVKLRMR